MGFLTISWRRGTDEERYQEGKVEKSRQRLSVATVLTRLGRAHDPTARAAWRTAAGRVEVDGMPDSVYTRVWNRLTHQRGKIMNTRLFTAIIERCPDTGLLVGSIPGWPGAHTQGETLAELDRNLAEVIGMLLEDGEPALESEFVGTRTIEVEVPDPCPSSPS
jgi:predicted RNase H-like HicB family nuclease